MQTKVQKGFSLVPALFLLVVLAALGIVAVRLSAVQQQTVVLAMQSARAYAAARSGVDWSAYQALVNGSCASSTLSLTEAGLDGFSVDTTCSSTTHAEGPNTVTVFVIDAFAWSGNYGTPDYVSRRIRSTVTDAT
ncbi:MAG: pilus assembly protein MshP [Gammaproteobacteria bacterium]|nr:pilus assembly protein MshP [Gammaproteobacteria bacterium]MDH3373219.1 pilus assembly protein MshP [Gammaproteobacteria bacterium]MDH3410615.1 pilus assembly protein MshP [Gammaproteobacteria bacterium]MDH3553782.1 pilus assembly protein MshP [Gammaproteobacteria bacterium]